MIAPDVVVSRLPGRWEHATVDAKTAVAETWCAGQVTEWETGHGNTLVRTYALVLIDRARAVGLTVELRGWDIRATPTYRRLIPVRLEGEDPWPGPWRPMAAHKAARDVHHERLRQLRGQLTGEDKTAVRWALEHIERLEKRLADIRRLT